MNLLNFFTRRNGKWEPEEIVNQIFQAWTRNIWDDSFFEKNEHLICNQEELKNIAIIAGRMFFMLTKQKTPSFIFQENEELFSQFFIKLLPYVSSKITKYSLQEVAWLLDIIKSLVEAGTIGMDIFYSKIDLTYFFQSIMVLREQKSLDSHCMEILNSWYDTLPNTPAYYLGTWKTNQKLQLNRILFQDSSLIKESGLFFSEYDAFGVYANQLFTLIDKEKQRYWADFITYCCANDVGKNNKKHSLKIQWFIDQISIKSYLDVISILTDHIEKMDITQNPDYHYSVPEFIYIHNREILKGIFVGLGLVKEDTCLQMLHRCALSFYKKIPNKWPASISLWNICVSVMSEYFGMQAVSYLFQIWYKVKHPSIQKYIDKQIQKLWERIGYSPEMLEDISIQDYKIENWVIQLPVGDWFHAVLSMWADLLISLIWKDENDKVYKKIPESIHEKYDLSIRDIKQQKKELQLQFSYQKFRFETLMMSGRKIEASHFRNYFLHNSTVNLITKTLIWNIYDECDKKIDTVTFYGDKVWDINNTEVVIKDNYYLQLYHPWEVDKAFNISWGEKLKNDSITQAIKQTAREIFLKTFKQQAFLNITLQQHQAVALAKERGWIAKLQWDFDSGDEGFIKKIPSHNLLVQLIIDPNRDEEITNAGIFSEVCINNILWKQLDNMDVVDGNKVDDRVFSEILRDIALIVAVSRKDN